MANTSRINGFKPVKHLNGSPFNGQGNIYEVPAGETIPVFIGDLVKLSTAAPTSNYPACANVSTATTANNVAAIPVLGAVLGVFNAKVDIDGKMTTGSISLDQPIYRPASTKQFVLVADSPDIVYEVQATASYALADIGLNADIASADMTTSGALTTGASPQTVATTAASASATRPLQVLGFSTRVDNEPAGAFNKLLVKITTHAFGNAIAGV
jgi:hypothetical protein